MSFDWNDFLRFAEKLSSDPDAPGPPEAAFRSAASRAYYAAFHSAMSFAIPEGFSPTYRGDDHFAIRAHFRNFESTEPRRKVSVELGRLYELRREADYFDTLRTQPANITSYALGMAKRIISTLNSLECIRTKHD